jgi:hypothetical protein
MIFRGNIGLTANLSPNRVTDEIIKVKSTVRRLQRQALNIYVSTLNSQSLSCPLRYGLADRKR